MMSEGVETAAVQADRRKPWPVFAVQCLVVLAVILAGGKWFMAHYTLGLASGTPCLPGRLYIVEKGLPPVRHGLVAFRTDDRQRPYRPGTKFVKLVVGLPGDQVEINAACRGAVVSPDGAYPIVLEDRVLDRLGKDCRDLAGSYEIPADSYFVVGTLPDSYDSRYWGLVSSEQVIGRAWKVF
jgi:conjugal transfer pilin signal peptidase TrbI